MQSKLARVSNTNTLKKRKEKTEPMCKRNHERYTKEQAAAKGAPSPTSAIQQSPINSPSPN
jgi:hypothetical protein